MADQRPTAHGDVLTTPRVLLLTDQPVLASAVQMALDHGAFRPRVADTARRL